MSYFSDNYNKIQYPTGADNLRNSQIGAIHAIASHFTLYDREPALVIMPTGSGKTAVLIMSSFVQKSKRTLVISSSILVRGQIMEEYETLKTLKKLGVLNQDITPPKVFEIVSPIKTIEEWNKLKDYDVVIGIPKSISSGISEEIFPPDDLFDLILVDEAHHSSATTWKHVIKFFSEAKKVFFTATPFRRDKKEVEGKIVYNYPLSKAKKDQIFGEIGFYPVIGDIGETNDISIAKATEKTLLQDRDQGYEHFILVRTNTKKHAEELERIYSQNTKLNLRRVDSRKSYRYIKATINKLKKKELDGIICVDMLGEGFDFPNLKIAAIHAPHKSLAITLQFIGRFARTNAENIGTAKFLAIPNNIEIGKKQLFSEEKAWNDLIVDLSEERIMEEDITKTVLDTFTKDEKSEIEEKGDISLYNLSPYSHVKIYRITDFNINGTLSIAGHETAFHYISEEHNAVIIITKETSKPKWIISDEIVDVNYFLFITYFDQEQGLLFIHSPFKTHEFYDYLVAGFSSDTKPERIPKADIHKVLSGLTDTEIFNLGMLNRSANSGESYRTIAGPNAPNMVKKYDGRMYSNGHIFGKAKNEEFKNITIGYSSGSKVWSNAYQKIPALITWCKLLGKKINSDVEVKTNTGLDNLPIGIPIKEFPASVYAASWDKDTYTNSPLVIITDKENIQTSLQLLDFEIVINSSQSTKEILSLDLTHDLLTIPLKYSFKEHFQFRTASDSDLNISNMPIISYLNENPLQFYLTDFSSVIYGELHKPIEGDILFANDQIIVKDWAKFNTDIQVEFYDNSKTGQKEDNDNRNSVQDTVAEMILDSSADIVIFDHGNGEMADFVIAKQEANEIKINLIHIKGSGGTEAGDRVNDVYEVCGQAIKSLLWTTSKSSFHKKVSSRTKNNPLKFKSGNYDLLDQILLKDLPVHFTITIVQPGITKNGLSSKLSTILGATDQFISSNGNNEKLVVWSSK